jgi:hypothetical protein
MRKRLLKAAAGTVAVIWYLSLVLPVHARQAPIFSLLYPAGWSMVGVPLGSAFYSGALKVRGMGTVSSNGLTLSSSGCRGYWVLFSTSGEWSSFDKPTPAHKTCHLHRGTNLVGNPFLTGALLPGSVHATYWDVNSTRYVPVHEMPLDGAVKISVTKPRTITLHAAPATPVTSLGPMTYLPATPPHVPVDSVFELSAELVLSQPAALSDPRHMILERSTVQFGRLPVVVRWQWRATKPGKIVLHLIYSRDHPADTTFQYPIVIDPAS